jgi:hypothetical protein
VLFDLVNLINGCMAYFKIWKYTPCYFKNLNGGIYTYVHIIAVKSLNNESSHEITKIKVNNK